MKIMSCYCVLVLVLVLVIITSCQHSSENVLVNTSAGIIRGHVLETWTKNKYYAFKGIPYAEPPTGKLRFKAPVRVRSWEGIKDATKDGKICPQADPGFVGGPVDENCLYLNVYSKKLHGSLPVIVFIHPGGFRFMTGASTWYGPDYLLDHNIVFVTFNYRLDALGFLSTGDKLATGNFGMKDQVEVLKWIQKNIIHFGGNPQQVTITGDSSGAASVFLHMLSPMSQGLFHKAVAMSGGIVGTIKWLTSRQQIIITEKLAKHFNCPIKPANDMVECLRNIPADEINSKFRETEELGPRVALNFGPVIESEAVDGEERFLLDHPSTLFKKKSFNHVPVITGITEYELVRKAVGIAKNKTLVEKLNNEFDTIAPILFEYDDKTLEEKQKLNNALRKFYFGNHTINNASSEVLGQMFSDYMINYGEYATVNLLSKYSDESVYFYKFSYQGRYGHEYDPVTNKTLGPGHINDLMYLFYASKLFPKFKESDKEAVMVKMQTSIWYNFASNGNPTPSGSPIEWTPVTANIKKYINIDSLLTMEDGLPFPERMKLWESLYPV